MKNLEAVITALVERKNAAGIGSAEHAFCERQLRFLRYRYEDAGDLIEGIDPDHWGCYCRPLAASAPQGQLVPMPRKRKSVSRDE